MYLSPYTLYVRVTYSTTNSTVECASRQIIESFRLKEAYVLKRPLLPGICTVWGGYCILYSQINLHMVLVHPPSTISSTPVRYTDVNVQLNYIHVWIFRAVLNRGFFGLDPTTGRHVSSIKRWEDCGTCTSTSSWYFIQLLRPLTTCTLYVLVHVHKCVLHYSGVRRSGTRST
jgi:hypothetical protein